MRGFAAVIVAALAATPAHALGRQETACQAAIAKAGKAFVAAELANRGRCKMKAAKGKACDSTGRSGANRSKLRKVVARCNGVALGNLNAGSCAARSADDGTNGLAQCLIDGHTQAIDTLLVDQFGLAASEREVLLSGTLAQAGSTLVPPPQLMRYRALGVRPLALSDLSLFCVTFAEPPTSGSAQIAADGSFALRIAAIGVPFGCFVVEETTGEQVATLVFRGQDGDSTQVQTDDGTLVLGTVTLDLGKGEAVVDASRVQGATVCEEGVTNPVDFTGLWRFTCTPGPPGSGYGCPPPGDQGGGPEQIYLHRVPGTAPDGTPRHWIGAWAGVEFFRLCGQVEGLATEAGGTATASGDTLGVPDGPFAFASESQIFPLIDPFTFVTPPPPPGGGPAPRGFCNSTAEHCSGVRNNDGNPCSPPQPGTPPDCWGAPDFSTQPPTFVPFTDEQCRQMCYAMNLYGGGGDAGLRFAPALTQAGLCVEQALIDWSAPPGSPGAIKRTGNPVGRFMLDRLRYSCNDAASVVHRFPTEIVGLPPDPTMPPGPPPLCHVTRRVEITFKMEGPSRILGDFKESASLEPGDPAACTDDSNPQNWLAEMLRNPMRMLFTLTR
jgi:hypothetical protein